MVKEGFNSELWDEWVVICNKYLKTFCEKHGYDFDDATNSWVAGFDGTVVLCGDEYVSMEDIIIDIEKDAPEEEFLKWYWYCLDANDAGASTPNYSSWLNGCPRLSKEELERYKEKKENLKRIKRNTPDDQKLIELKKEFGRLIDEYIKDDEE